MTTSTSSFEALMAQALGELHFPSPVGAVVDGEWVGFDGAATCSVVDPGSGTVLAEVVDGDPDMVDQAVTSADTARRGTWSRFTSAERGRMLVELAAAIRHDADRLARLEVLDTGKPLRQALGDVETSARYFEYYGGAADKIHGETIEPSSDLLAYTRREPYGVVGHIIPWNSPLSQMSRGVAPSLAAGNTAVVKPSELAPLSTVMAAKLFADAGLPPGVVNVVPGHGTTGADLVRHPSVAHMTFTGSVETGKAVLAVAASRVIGSHLELGGKSPTIILDDADLAAAARAGAHAVVRNSGQSCTATTRILIHQAVHDEVVEAMLSLLDQLSVGHGLTDPDVGPLISPEHLARVGSFVDGARRDGAEVRTGGAQMETEHGGSFYAPTLLTGVRNAMDIAATEVFGPVQCVMAFEDVDEAVALANDSRYGLSAGVFTKDITKAHRIAARLESGQVLVNRYPIADVAVPFGGYKESGLGREKGLESLLGYTQTKSVMVALDDR